MVLTPNLRVPIKSEKVCGKGAANNMGKDEDSWVRPRVSNAADRQVRRVGIRLGDFARSMHASDRGFGSFRPCRDDQVTRGLLPSPNSPPTSQKT